MRSAIEVGGRRIYVQMTYGADQWRALFEAIHAGSVALLKRNPWRYHVAAENEALERQVLLMGELDRALDRGEVEHAFEPRLALAQDYITSVKALVRWHHP